MKMYLGVLWRLNDNLGRVGRSIDIDLNAWVPVIN